MHIKGSKNVTPSYLYIAYLSGFKKGGGSKRVYNLICFIITVTYSIILLYSIYFFLKERVKQEKRERERERINKLTFYVF